MGNQLNNVGRMKLHKICLPNITSPWKRQLNLLKCFSLALSNPFLQTAQHSKEKENWELTEMNCMKM